MDFYYMPASAPCRSIQLLAKAIGVDLNLKLTNLRNNEQLTPEFIKINPQHTIPTLVDNGHSVWESRAILMYIAEKYAKDDSLYPKDPVARSVVNQRLYFDMGTLYQRFADYWYPQVFTKAAGNPENFKKMEGAVEFLNTFLEGNKYAAGDSITLADFALVPTISTYEVSGFDLSKYPNVVAWYDRCKTNMVGYELNQEGAEIFKRDYLAEAMNA